MPNPNPLSPRMSFQWKYFDTTPKLMVRSKYGPTPNILNVGCSDDPLSFPEDEVVHLDIDDWSARFRYFVQADACEEIPFGNRTFDLVIVGDVHEHAMNPKKLTAEAARVCRGTLVMTIFEEWKLPGPGQHVEASHMISNAMSQDLGYEDREDYQLKNFPDRIGVNDDETPHLVHINQFVESDIDEFVRICEATGFKLLERAKIPEGIHEGHTMHNWLVAMERIR